MRSVKTSDVRFFGDSVGDIANRGYTSEENNETAQSWVPWFTNRLKCRVKFDTTTSNANNRPDLQVWATKKEQENTGFAPLWLEAKPFDSFASKAKKKAAIRESFKKIQDELLFRSYPPALIVSDLDTIMYWSSERILEIVRNREDPSKNFKLVTGSLKLSEQNNESLRRFADFIHSSMCPKKNEPISVDLDVFVTDLLSVTNIFQDKVLPDVFEHLAKKKRVGRVFEAWKAHGGSTTLALVKKDDSNHTLGDEETFAELCFHTLVVRMFAVKWCLDHGYLAETSLEQSWKSLASNSSKGDLDNVLRPKGASEVEKILAVVFSPTDMYMWVNQVLTDEIRSSLFSSFQKQLMLTAETDILGEFYQRYLSVYSKRSQFELGQFYTPHNLVRAMWKLTVDMLARRGLSLDDDSTIVVDPAAGTGTFLSQGLRQSISGNCGENRKKIPGAKISKFIKKFSGLEVNPFSKGVADINYLTEILTHCSNFKSCQVPIPSIFETNSYEVDPDMPEESFDDADDEIRSWIERWSLSSKAKNKTKYRIVIGNPPWRNPSPVNANPDLKDFVDTKIVPWAHSYKKQRLSSIRGCNHGIREDYVFFMGVANNLVQSDGLICYVTSESWLDSPTYTLVRKYLLDHFNIARIIRIGPYFRNVAQPAVVFIMERDESCGRNQKIYYLDWSELGNKEYSSDWINKNLSRVTAGKVKKSEWQTVNARDENCILIPSDYDSKGLDDYLVSFEELFNKSIIQGAQPGYTPLFVDSDRSEVIRKLRLLFSGTKKSHTKLASELGPQTRGGSKKAYDLIGRAYDKICASNAKFDLKAVRKIYAHFKGLENGSSSKVGFCYFDSRIWHRPRVSPPVKPVIKTIWDNPIKLIFRDFSDTGKKKKTITAFVDEKRRIVDNHCINGGCQVVPFDDKLECLNELYRTENNLNAREWCFYIYAMLNSSYAEGWAEKKAKQRIKLPASKIFNEKMREISKQGLQYCKVIELSKSGKLEPREQAKLDIFRSNISSLIEDLSAIAEKKRLSEQVKLESAHKDLLRKAKKGRKTSKKPTKNKA